MSGGGKFEFDDGGFYVGEWVNGHAEGFGVCTGPKNMGKFEGMWKDGAEVSGVYSWPGGLWYKGEWNDGHRNGYGIEKEDIGGKIYSGQFLNGNKHGSGVVYVEKNGKAIYEGTWKNGYQDGYGIEIYKEGGYYAGQWKDGLRHGFGVRGQTDGENLKDGSISLKEMFLSGQIKSRPATMYGLDQILNGETQADKNGEVNILRKTSSSPAKLNLKSTPEKKKRMSVFQSMRPFRRPSMETVKVTETYKGYWNQDQHDGFGICYYGDGSRFIGEWKENRRHGHGIIIDKDGMKSGGKWYNDNLLLVTRRKNLKIPIVRKKANRTILSAIDAAEMANKKMKLAINRGLSSKKIGETAKEVAKIAEMNAKCAIESRKKYTLHPCLEATLKDFSRQNSTAFISDSLQGSDSSSPDRLRKASSVSKLAVRKKSSILNSLRCHSDNHLDLDVMRSLEKHPVHELGLYQAMDTSIAAGAMNPYISQMILMNYNDAQSRMSRAISSTGNLGNIIHETNLFTPLALTGRYQGASQDSTDSGCKRFYESSESSVNNSKSFLHPADFTTSRRRKFGVGGNASFESTGSSSITSEDARLVQMKGKLLTGDEIDYEYVAVNTNVDGKDMLVLHTDHPKPKMTKDHTISEKTVVNSATGLYRTVVGNVPGVLLVTKPTGIPSLDSRRESVDSGTANEETSNLETTTSVPLAATTNLPPNGSPLQQTDHRKVPKKKDVCNSCQSSPSQRYNAASISFSYSPSLENIQKMHKKNVNKLERRAVSLNDTGAISDQKGNSVSIVCGSNIKQVVIPHPITENTRTKELSTQTSFDSSSMDSINKINRFKITDWLSKRLWSRQNSTNSVRSLSTDSGYKQSMSMDDNTIPVSPKMRDSPHPPINEVNSEDQDEVEDTNNTVLSTNIATNENYRLHSYGEGTSCPSFNQYETIPEPTNLQTTLEHVRLPTFYSSSVQNLATDDYDEKCESERPAAVDNISYNLSPSMMSISDEYVILEGDLTTEVPVITESSFEKRRVMSWV